MVSCLLAEDDAAYWATVEAVEAARTLSLSSLSGLMRFDHVIVARLFRR